MNGLVPLIPRPVYRPYGLRNTVLSQLAAGAIPLRLFALIGRFSPRQGVTAYAKDHKKYLEDQPVQHVTSGPPPSSPFARGVPIWLVVLNEDLVTSGGLSELAFDFVPTELKYNPSPNFSAIKPIGRNLPHYHYGGSEDTLSLEIDWYGYKDAPVIEKCRFIEGLTKANGWEQAPPRVKLYWGDNTLFKDHEFIVTGASYRLRTFTFYKNRGSLDNLQPYHLWPVHATQSLVLKRVSNVQHTRAQISSF